MSNSCSGSYVMSYVLADQQGWLKSSSDSSSVFDSHVPLGDFAALRNGVNEGDKADFFMWEHFTTKKFYDNGELKRVGEIYTPWPSWVIAARDAKDRDLETMAEKINQGVAWFQDYRKESVEHITSTMEYSKEDAEAWLETVKFTKNVRGVDTGLVEKTVEILQKAGVLDEKAGTPDDFIAIKKASQGA